MRGLCDPISVRALRVARGLGEKPGGRLEWGWDGMGVVVVGGGGGIRAGTPGFRGDRCEISPLRPPLFSGGM